MKPGSGAEILDQDVGAGRQRLEELAASRGCGRVPARVLDLEDVSAVVPSSIAVIGAAYTVARSSTRTPFSGPGGGGAVVRSRCVHDPDSQGGQGKLLKIFGAGTGPVGPVPENRVTR